MPALAIMLQSPVGAAERSMPFIDTAELPGWRGRLSALCDGKAIAVDHPQRPAF